VKLLDLIDDGVPFFAKRSIDHIRVILADHRTVGRDHHDVDVVCRAEFLSFGFRRTGHARELFVHSEVVLQRDGRERLVLSLDLDAFFRLDGLVKPIRPAAALHQAAGEVVDDDHLAFLHDVMVIAFVKRVGLECLLDAVKQVHIARIVEIVDAQQLFGL
jgi:hypothetical protein